MLVFSFSISFHLFHKLNHITNQLHLCCAASSIYALALAANKMLANE